MTKTVRQYSNRKNFPERDNSYRRVYSEPGGCEPVSVEAARTSLPSRPLNSLPFCIMMQQGETVSRDGSFLRYGNRVCWQAECAIRFAKVHCNRW
ncbi:hypothetical protein E5329_19030 [Petralouisia muris]|uniref:Uncharacterized protein n=1 Tax=Petralouisia muris TaxID=3032872 RepID=A0AC61RRU8_9FIRM|nr:hypothetical protein [Petralouisia muris]TGY92630.1 hypothetical protein E5329_19030 [Petralouisia muris]